jgi:hypothetical protein
MNLYKSFAFLGLALAVFACGGEATRLDEQGSGGGGSGGRSNDDKNGSGGDSEEGVACTTSAECGSLSCLCGVCQGECEGAVICSQAEGGVCVGNGPATEAVAKSAAFAVRPGQVQGNDIAPGPDGSVLVVGGATPVPIDFGTAYRDFWLARFDARGNPLWQVVEPQDETQSPGQSVTFGDDLLVITLSTRYVEGSRTLVRQFGIDGTRISDEQLDPELTIARQSPTDEGAWLAGSELSSTTGGRPFLRARVERLGVQTGQWPASFAGLTGSVSAVLALALDDEGNASVSGYLGIDAESNRSVPWVARLSPRGETIFETKIAVSDDSHCSADAIAVTTQGVTLSAGYCEGNWLKAFSPDGKLLWERRFPEPISALASLADGGYLVATGEASNPNGSFNPNDDWTSAHADLLAFDAEHHLLTRVTEPTCSPFHRILVTPDGVYTLASCGGELEIAKYDLP